LPTPSWKTSRSASSKPAEPWFVVLYNDDIHTFNEVILQLVRATSCSLEQARAFAWTVHTEGKATVYTGPFEECLRVKGVLEQIALVVDIRG